VNPDDLQAVYAAIGRTLWHLQFLEDALVSSVTLRANLRPGLKADDLAAALASERKKTLGAVFKSASDAGLVVGSTAEALRLLIDERNWLVHRSMHEASDGVYQEASRTALLDRLSALTDHAIAVKNAIATELFAWCADHGMDMQRVESLAAEHVARVRGA
jgi:hypothetical protein